MRDLRTLQVDRARAGAGRIVLWPTDVFDASVGTFLEMGLADRRLR